MNYRLFIMSCFLGLSFFVPMKLFAECPTINSEVSLTAAASQIKNKALAALTGTSSEEEDKLRKAKNGNADCSSSPKKTKPIKTDSYEYVKKEILLAEDSKILASESNYSTAVKKVTDTLFATQDEDSSSQSFLSKLGTVTGLKTSKIQKVGKQRKKYLKEVSNKTSKIFSELPKKVREDAQSVNDAQTVGCNQLHGYMYENRNLLALIKSTAAHIGAQVLNMEFQSIKDITKQPVRLVHLEDEQTETETKTETK